LIELACKKSMRDTPCLERQQETCKTVQRGGYAEEK